MKLFGLDLDRFARQLDLPGLWHWWMGELLQMLPQRWRFNTRMGPDRLLLEFDGDELILSREDYEGEQVVRRFHLATMDEVELKAVLERWTARGYQPTIRLPARQTLCKTFSLPLAAEENLHQVMKFEMDRHTPFKADQVYYDVRVLSRDSRQKKLRVRLCTAPRALLGDTLAKLRVWGIKPVAVMPVQDPQMNLLPREQRAQRRRLSLSINRLLLGLAVVLLLNAAVFPLWQMRSVVLHLNERIAAVQTGVQAVEALRTERDRLEQRLNFIVEHKLSRPPLVELLNELSRMLPDHTWVNYLAAEGDELTLRGESVNSSGLIETIESSPYFEGTAFQAPVTKDDRSGREVFSIATRIRREAP